jgi:hypothetical protein
MTSSALFFRFDQKAQDWLRMNCPGEMAATYLSRKQWRLPVLAGTINCPTLRPDGCLLATAGYDAQTGLLFEPEGCTFQLGEHPPSRDEALDALSRLIGVIATFKFVNDADLSVAISGILSALIQHSLDTVPLHAFTAPVAGSENPCSSISPQSLFPAKGQR